MRISGWHMDGFGRFRDFRVEELPPGLTVVFGPNEAGKSTLLAFIRGVLFGFPDGRSKERRYPPLSGGRAGGRLFVTDDSGAGWTIERQVSPQRVTVTHPDGSVGAADDLEVLIGTADKELFRNIFAFSLPELDSFETLNTTGVKSRIFASVSTGAGKSPGEVADDLSKRQDKLLKVRGSAAINDLRKELKDLKSRLREAREITRGYPRLVADAQDAESVLSELTAKRDLVGRKLARCTLLQSLWPDWLERVRASEELSQLPEVHGVTGETEGKLSELLEATVRAEEKLSDKKVQLDEIGERRSKVVLDETLDGCRIEVDSLCGELVRFEDLSEERRDLRSTLEERRSRMKQDFAADLGEEHRPAAGMNSEELQRIEDSASRLRDLIHRRSEAEARLESARTTWEGRRTSKAENPGGPRRGMSGRPQLALIGSLLLCAIAASVITKSYVTAGILAAAFVIVAMLLWRSPSSNAGVDRSPSLDELIDQAQEEVRRREETLEALGSEISKLASSLGLVAQPTQPDIEELLRSVGRMREEGRLRGEIAGLEKKLGEVSARIEDFGTRARSILARAGCTIPERDDELRQALERLREACREDGERRRDIANMQQAIKKMEVEVQDALRASESVAERLAELVSSCGATDVEGLRRNIELYRRRSELSSAAATAQRRIDERIGTGSGAEEILVELQSGEAASWQDDLEMLREQSEHLDRERDEALRKLQSAQDERRRVEESADLISLSSQECVLRARLEDEVDQWSVVALAHDLVAQTISRFERRHQPKVVNRARGLFSAVTAGRYDALVSGEGSLAVIDREGRRVDAGSLSTGTAQQLYLCLRVGLAEEFSARGTSLPLVMDEVLVSFDPARAAAVARVVSEVARSRQVIMMTCHPQTVEALEEAAPGLRVLSLVGGGT